MRVNSGLRHAKDTRPDYKYDRLQLNAGVEIEMEHTRDPKIAKTIAKDHLDEIPDYYTRLIYMECEAKQLRRNNPTRDLEQLARKMQAETYGSDETDDWREAGVIFRDGSLLRFGSGGSRLEDHRILASLLEEPKEGEYRAMGERWHRLTKFLVDTHSIRFLPEVPAFDIFLPPTRPQLRTIKRIVEDSALDPMRYDVVIVDLHDESGNRINSREFAADDYELVLDYLKTLT